MGYRCTGGVKRNGVVAWSDRRGQLANAVGKSEPNAVIELNIGGCARARPMIGEAIPIQIDEADGLNERRRVERSEVVLIEHVAGGFGEEEGCCNNRRYELATVIV